MKALKTIIATAVIVFALTTVAMASMQHFTKAQNAQAAGKVPVSYTVTLSAEQLAQLMGHQGQNATTQRGAHARHAQRRHHARHYQRSSGTYRSNGGSAWNGTSRSGSSHSSYRCYGRSCSGSSGSRSGSCWGGGGCW